MPRVLIFVFAVLAAAGAATAVYFLRENRALRDELAALRTLPRAAADAPASPVVATAPPEPATVEAAPAAAPSVSPGPASARDSGRRNAGDRRERGAEFLAQALSDPEARAAMLTRMKGEIDRRFGDYFVKLGLNETQIEALRTILAERQMARMEAGMLERTADSDQARTDAQAWRDAKLASTEAEINAMLGPDGMKNLQGYLDSAPQRQVVDDIARRANYVGAPLSSEASDQLLAAVQKASAETPLPSLPGRGRWNGADGEGGTRQPITAETVSTYMQDLRMRNQAIIDEARTFLTQPQLEALADQQIDEIQQTEAQLNFMLRNPDARGAMGGFRPGGGSRGPGG
jgi:hypothetical protein